MPKQAARQINVQDVLGKVGCPHDHDVVIFPPNLSHQRDASIRSWIRSHPGNRAFRAGVRQAREDHHVTQDGSQETAKKAAAREVIQKVKAQNPPGRFLTINNLAIGWVEMSDAEAFQYACREVHKMPVLEGKTCVELHAIVNDYMPPCIWCRICYQKGHFVTKSLMRHVLEVEFLLNFDFTDISNPPQTYVTQIFNGKYKAYKNDAVMNWIKSLGYPPLPTGAHRPIVWVPPLVPIDAGTLVMPDENPPRYAPDLIIQKYYPRAPVQSDAVQVHSGPVQVTQHAQGPFPTQRAPTLVSPARGAPEQANPVRSVAAQGTLENPDVFQGAVQPEPPQADHVQADAEVPVAGSAELAVDPFAPDRACRVQVGPDSWYLPNLPAADVFLLHDMVFDDQIEGADQPTVPVANLPAQQEMLPPMVAPPAQPFVQVEGGGSRPAAAAAVDAPGTAGVSTLANAAVARTDAGFPFEDFLYYDDAPGPENFKIRGNLQIFPDVMDGFDDKKMPADDQQVKRRKTNTFPPSQQEGFTGGDEPFAPELPDI